MSTAMITRADCEALDAADKLSGQRQEFLLPEGVIYLDGNSLGPMPRATPARVAEMVTKEWGQGLIRSWNDADWIGMPARIGDKIATLIGAEAGSVTVGDSTSVNAFKALGAALAARPAQRTILSQSDNFPTDLYVAEGLAGLLDRGHRLRRADGADIVASIDDDTAVVLLTHVNYRTGAMHNMASITRAAHAKGALIIWDLAHSAGAVPLDVGGAEADMAIGCGYKFLNGGPGAPGFLYAAPRLQEHLAFPITGWFGHETPFGFEPAFRPAAGIARAAVGTPPVISLAALECGVDLALRTPIAELREKSLRMTRLLFDLFAQRPETAAIPIATPSDDARRGSQICLVHDHAYEIIQALIDRGIIGDFRAPDIIRLGITPLTLTYVELWDTAATLAEILRTDAWRDPRHAVRRTVT